MKTKHTAGPFSFSGISGDNHIMAKIYHGRGTIWYVCGHPGIEPEQHDANKQFIVKAMNSHEELLSALKLARATIDRLHRHAPGSATGTLNVVDSAIANAES